MSINFPNSPVNGDTYTFNAVTYVYSKSGTDEGYWRVALPSVSGVATVAEVNEGINSVKYISPLAFKDSEYVVGINSKFNATFNSVANMISGLLSNGNTIVHATGQNYSVIDSLHNEATYSVTETPTETNLGGGLFARKGARWTQMGANPSGFVDAPNVIAGHYKNAISADVHSSTIAGGGLLNKENVIGGIAANVNTETSNVPTGGPTLGQQSQFCLIGGGYDNVCNGLANVITVGQHCIIESFADHGSIHGGSHNKIFEGSYNTIGGGTRNTVYSDGFSVISGGGDHWIGTVSTNSVIAGGSSNSIYGSFCTVSGGQSNTATADSSTAVIGGGSGNRVAQPNSTISGGNGNIIDTSGQGCAISGGIDNTASGECAAVVGGRDNDATANYSQASGRDAVAARAGTDTFANGKIFTVGDAQTSRIILKGNTSGLQTTTLLDIDGGSDFVQKTKISMGYTIRLVAHTLGVTNEGAVIILEGLATRGTSGVWNITSFTDKTVETLSTTGVLAELFDSVGSLRLKVTGVTGANLQWVAHVEFTENIG